MMEDNVINTMKYFSEALGLLPQPNTDALVLDPLVAYFQSLPREITESDIFFKADSIRVTTRYDEIQWINSYDITYVNTEHPEKYIQNCFDTSTNISKYIRDIVIDESIGERESIVVLLSVFESYLHSKVEFDYGMGIKGKFLDAVKKDGRYSAETIALAVFYAIVKIVYANTNDEQFDKQLPHRNDILHNGTLSYSDDEIKVAYRLLLSFICIIDEMIARN